MRQPQSIRLHLAAVFLLFFALVVVLGSFSIWRLANFNMSSADVAEVWLPTTRALGDLNNYTSDFRAFEGSVLLASDRRPKPPPPRKQMEELDRTIAEAERNFERIRHDAAEDGLYARFKEDWNAYRGIVNQMLVLARTDRKDDALRMYGSSSRTAYNAASDTLGQLTDQAVASAQAASDRLAVAYRSAFWLILFAIVIAGVLVVARAHPYHPLHFRAASRPRRPHAPPCRATRPASTSPRPNGRTRSAKWRRRPSCSATTRSS